MDTTIATFTLLILFFLFTIFKLLHSLFHNHKPPLPPGPHGLPIIGNLHQLGQNPHQSLANFAKIHGPIISLKLGQITTIVMSSSETAKSVLQINDQFLSNRKIPDAMRAANHHQHSLPFIPVSQHWRDLRKTCNNLLFSNKTLDASRHLRQTKILELFRDVNERCVNGEAVDIGKLVFKTTINLLSNTVYSVDLVRSTDKAGEFKELVASIMREVGRPNVADCFPVLKIIDPLGIRRRTGEYFEKMMSVFKGLVDERMKVREERGYSKKSDMLDAMLDNGGEEKNGEVYADQIKRLSLLLMESPKIEPSMNDFSPNIQVTPVEPVDYGKHFTTSRIFYSRDELVTWARNIGKSIGSVIVIARSDNGRSSKKQFVMLACERSGKYKPYKKTGLHSTNTRKCMCPFRLKGSLVKSDGGWIAKVMCGFHNHYLQASLEGHPFIGRLTSEEKTVVENLTMNMVGPKQVMTALKNNNKDNSTTIMQVYNARKTYRTNLRKGRTELQYLMNLMLRDEYIHWHRKDDGDVVTDICWVHPDSVKLLNSFHIVLLIDATYKTNKYRMPLVEIVGVTSTNKTFVVAFAFIKSENVESYSWVLQKVKSLFYIDNVVPQVIVTDRELALMKAISDVFPSTTHLLCQFHIKKCVKAKAKLEMKGEAEKVELVMQEFDNLMYCPAVEEYEEQLKLFEKNCAPFDDFVTYVHKEWLTPYKEKFVQAWIDRVMHLGNTTTNRVESSHWQLKRLLRDSMGNLCSCWDTMNNSIRLQLTEIQASFEHSISRLKHCYNSPLYKILNSVVSTAALDLIAGELKRAGGVGIDCSQCGCVIRKTHGLPCSCELARYTMGYTPIPLDAIHIHWRILHLNNNCYTDQTEGSELSLDVEFDAIRRRFEQSDVIAKRVLKAQVRELAFPDTTSLCPPNVKVSTKGAPKKRKAVNMEKSTKRNPSW